MIDGQHRAMALLAIDRTIRSSWQGGPGARYRYFFYEARIKELMKNAISERHRSSCYAPLVSRSFLARGSNRTRRRVSFFVDVNKEARTPSESRLILLSDGELINILTRTTLTQLRNQADNEFLPLYCVEYDNPDTKKRRSRHVGPL